MPDQLRINDDLVASLRTAMLRGSDSLGVVPDLIKRILKDGMWRERIEGKTGETIRFDRFETFVATAPLQGLGADMKIVRNLVRDDPEAMDLLDRAVQRPVGENQHTFGTREGGSTNKDLPVDNVHKHERPSGNTAAAALRRLRKDRPDLHADVVKGKKSPHAAMVEAGFRKKPTALQTLKRSWKAATTAERESFLKWTESQRSA